MRGRSCKKHGRIFFSRTASRTLSSSLAEHGFSSGASLPTKSTSITPAVNASQVNNWAPTKLFKFLKNQIFLLDYRFLLSISLRDMHDSMNGQISPPVVYFDGSNIPDRSQHPPYVPPCTICVYIFSHLS